MDGKEGVSSDGPYMYVCGGLWWRSRIFPNSL